MWEGGMKVAFGRAVKWRIVQMPSLQFCYFLLLRTFAKSQQQKRTRDRIQRS
jgi:hypothetical protein